MTRQPLKFDIGRSPPTPSETAKARVEEGKKQVGARISADLYRRLKSQAALQGKTVQELVEQAIAQFLG
jgi:hypothetical protein